MKNTIIKILVFLETYVAVSLGICAVASWLNRRKLEDVKTEYGRNSVCKPYYKK